MPTIKKVKIPTAYLPDNWREKGAELFKCSASKVEKVCYGQLEDIDVLAWLTTQAEDGKLNFAVKAASTAAKKAELSERIKSIVKS